MKKSSILGQTYTDGYRDGWGQAAQLSCDDAFEAGRTEGWAQGVKVSAWSRLCWFVFGVACGTVFFWGLTT